MWEKATVQDLTAGDIFSRWGRIFRLVSFRGQGAGELLDRGRGHLPPLRLGGEWFWPAEQMNCTVLMPVPPATKVLRYVPSDVWQEPQAIGGALNEGALRRGEPVPGTYAARRGATRPPKAGEEVPEGSVAIVAVGSWPDSERKHLRKELGRLHLPDLTFTNSEGISQLIGCGFVPKFSDLLQCSRIILVMGTNARNTPPIVQKARAASVYVTTLRAPAGAVQETPWSDPMLALETREEREPVIIGRRSNNQFINTANPFPDGDRYDEESDPGKHHR